MDKRYVKIMACTDVTLLRQMEEDEIREHSRAMIGDHFDGEHAKSHRRKIKKIRSRIATL
jgi:hypothetical protein